VKLPVGGRLQLFSSFWIKEVNDIWVTDVVTKGHSIEFKTKPSLSQKVRWTIIHDPQKSQVLAEEIQSLLEKDAIEPVDPLSPGYYSTFFVVPKRDGGHRPILNLKPLNKFVVYKKFRMETAKSVLAYLRRGNWLASVDLTDAYLHVPILPSHRPYLRFGFQGRTYQFKVLPFGLTSAPRVFTQVLAPLVGILHQWGIQFIPYLDDCLIVAPTQLELAHHIQLVQSLLTRAGFLINIKKSNLIPSQNLEFLGMRLDMDQGTVHLPLQKAQRLVQCVKICLKSVSVTARSLLQLLGLMASCLQVVPGARLLMRPLQLFFLSRWNFHTRPIDQLIPIPESLHQFLVPWSDVQSLIRGVPIQAVSPSRQIQTDASTMGWGGHMVVQGKTKGVQRKWNAEEKVLHINCQELLAVHRTLQAFQQHLKGHMVLVLTDNTTVRQYINKQGGTRSHQMCALTLKLFQWCQAHHIQLMAQHVPGVENVLADSLSRTFYPDTEWRLCPKVVQRLFLLWGTPLLDLFATGENSHCQVYASWRPDPGAFHVDALTLNWSNQFVYAFPPIPIIPLVIQKVLRDRPEMILITPFWPSRPWVASLLPLLVDDPVRLPIRDNLLTQNKGRVQHPSPATWSLVAWRLSADFYKIKAYQVDGAGTRIWIPFRPLSPR
jgi:hypothetical protein